MIDLITERTVEIWDELLPGWPKPETLWYVIESGNRVTIRFFDPRRGESKPVFVVKFQRHPKYNDWSRRALSHLQQTRSLLSPAMKELVPVAVSLGEINGLAVHAETIVSGVPITPPRRKFRWRAKVRADFQMVLDCLLALQQDLATDSLRLDEKSICAIIVDPLRQLLVSEGEGDGVTPHALVEYEARTREWYGVTIPRTWRYGDAKPANFLVSRNRVSGLVDWEGSRPDGWCTWDWFKFVFVYAINLYQRFRPSLPRSQYYLFAVEGILGLDPSPVGQEIAQWVLKFMETRGLSKELLPLVFGAFISRSGWLENKRPLVVKHALPILVTRR